MRSPAYSGVIFRSEIMPYMCIASLELAPDHGGRRCVQQLNTQCDFRDARSIRVAIFGSLDRAVQAAI